MSIEIKELHIKIDIDEGASNSGSSSSGIEGKEEIIAACVEEVMEVLKNQKER